MSDAERVGESAQEHEAMFRHGHRCFEPKDPSEPGGAGYLTTPMYAPCNIPGHQQLVTFEAYDLLRRAVLDAEQAILGGDHPSIPDLRLHEALAPLWSAASGGQS